jgi:hypothetical protein
MMMMKDFAKLLLFSCILFCSMAPLPAGIGPRQSPVASSPVRGWRLAHLRGGEEEEPDTPHTRKREGEVYDHIAEHVKVMRLRCPSTTPSRGSNLACALSLLLDVDEQHPASLMPLTVFELEFCSVSGQPTFPMGAAAQA